MISGQYVISNTQNVIGYKKLLAWEIADEFVNCVYDLTVNFPKDELYSLTSQLRRASLSVPANIIEGHARNNKNEFRHFLSISLGSLAEAGYYLAFALKRKYISASDFDKVESLRARCGQLLWRLYKSQAK